MLGDALLANMRLMPHAVITADSEAATMPASYLATEQPGQRWRATSLSAADAYINLSAVPAATGVTTYQFVGLIAHNGSSAGTFTVMTGASKAASSSSGTAAYVSSALPLWQTTDLAGLSYRHSWILLPAARSIAAEPWLHIKVQDAGNTAGFFDCGCVLIDQPFIPAYPLKPRPKAGSIQAVQALQSVLGAVFPREMPIAARRELVFQASGSAAIAALQNEAARIEREIRLDRAVFALLDRTPSTQAMRLAIYGLLESLPMVDLTELWSYLEIPYAINEMLPGWEPQE